MVSICVFDFLQERCRTITREKIGTGKGWNFFFGKTVLSTLYPIENSKSEGGIYSLVNALFHT